MDAIVLTAIGDSTVWDALDVHFGSIQATWAGATHSDGTLTLNESVDGTNYSANTTATTVTAGAGVKIWKVDRLYCRYYKVTVAPGSNTAGTVTVRVLGKV
jgi:CCR4-NOT transcriptional regulation complex NOT5 subunit